MALDELLISTGVDALIKLIYEKKKIGLEEAAKILELPFQTVEDWAQALEDEGIIRIDYQFTKVFLIWAKEGEYKLLEEIGDVSAQKENLLEMINTIKERIKIRSEELELIEKEYKKILDMFDPKITEIQKRIKSIKEFESKAEEIYQTHKSKIEDIENDLESLLKHLQEKEKEWEKLSDELKSPKYQAVGVEMLKDFETKLKTKVDTAVKRLDELSEEIKKQKSAYADISSVTEKIKLAEKDIEEIKKLNTETEAKISKIKEKQELLEKSLKKTGKGDVASNIDALVKKLETVSGTVPEIKKKVENISKNIKKEVSVLNELAAAYKELQGKEGKTLFNILEKKQMEFQKKISELKDIVEGVEKAKALAPNVKRNIKDLGRDTKRY